MTTPVLLTVPEAAAQLGLSPATVWGWVGARRITSVKVGRARRIPASEVERLIAAGTTYAHGLEPVKPLAEARARLRLLASQRRAGGAGGSAR